MSEFKYYAFISYKREDEKWAVWLQHKLEHYKLPANLNGRTDLPKEIRPIFKDTSELNPGNLPQQIHDALEQSRYLIVICSPRSAQSEWVNREVETFIQMGGTDKIIPFIIEGNAFSKNPDTECFPQALRNLPAEQEILGANINEMGRDAAAVKVVAQMFGLRFDELWQRYEREQRRKRRWIFAASIAAFFIMAGVAGWIWRQNILLKEKDWRMMANRNRIIAEKANSLIDAGDNYLARIVTLEALNTGPFVPELEYSLRNSALFDRAILRGHTGIVFSVAYSPDGTCIASGSADKNICIWNTKTGECMNVLSGHEGFVETVIFSPDGKYVISGSLDKTIRVWNLSDGRCVKVLNEHSSEVDGIFFLPDGKTFVSLSENSYYGPNVIFWDYEELKCIQKKECPNARIVSPDGKLYATGGHNEWDSNWIIYDINTGEKKHTLTGHSDQTKLAFSPDGKLIVTGGGDNKDNTIRIWDSETGKCLEVLQNIDLSIIYSIHFSPDGKQIITAQGGYVYGNQYVIRIWKNEGYGWIFDNELKGHDGNVYDAVYSHDMKHIVSGSEDKTVRIWDLSDGITMQNIGAGLSFDDAMISPDGSCIVTVSATEWGISSILSDNNLIKIEGSPSVTPAFNPDGKTFVSATDDGIVGIWSVETGKCIKTLEGHNKGVNAFAYSPNGEIVASASEDMSVRLWDTESGQRVGELKNNYGAIMSIAFMPSGHQIVSATETGLIQIWNVDSGECIQSLDEHIDLVNSVDVSADGRYILSASNDGTIRLWDGKKGECMRLIGQHEGPVWEARFSPDAKLVAAEESDNLIRVWDIESNQCIYMLNERHRGDDGSRGMGSISFNAEGNKIFSVIYIYFEEVGLIHIWDFPPLQELIDETRERFKNRPLTPEEKRMYYLE